MPSSDKGTESMVCAFALHFALVGAQHVLSCTKAIYWHRETNYNEHQGMVLKVRIARPKYESSK